MKKRSERHNCMDCVDNYEINIFFDGISSMLRDDEVECYNLHLVNHYEKKISEHWDFERYSMISVGILRFPREFSDFFENTWVSLGLCNYCGNSGNGIFAMWLTREFLGLWWEFWSFHRQSELHVKSGLSEEILDFFYQNSRFFVGDLRFWNPEFR